MNIKFLFLLFVLLPQVNSNLFSDLRAATEEGSEDFYGVSSKLSEVLETSKPQVLNIRNNTNIPVSLCVYDFYHPEFEEEDFSLNTGITTVFDARYKVMPGNDRKVSIGIDSCSQVSVKPYRDKSRLTAVVLKSSVDIPTAGGILRAIDSSYIGALTCEDTSKYISCRKISEREIDFAIETRHFPQIRREIFEKNLFEMNVSAGKPQKFIDYFLSTVLKEHSRLFKGSPEAVRQQLFRKFQTIHQAGLSVIDNQGNEPIIPSCLKIPQITHTFLLREKELPLLSENQKNWLINSVKSFSTVGWRHFIWIAEDSSVLQDDLRDVAGMIEIKQINSAGFDHLSDITRLINAGYNQHACAFLQYAALVKFGGVIRGINTEIIRDLTTFSASFSFYAGLDPKNTQMIHSGILAAAVDHPVINRAFELSFYHTQRKPLYLTNLKKTLREKEHVELAEHHIKYGGGVLNLAFYEHALAEKDMLFGPDSFSANSSLAEETYAIDHTRS